MLLANPFFLWIVHWFISALALVLTSWVVPGFRVRDFGSAMIAAAVIGIANVFIRPFLLFIALPLNILTLGLFTFVVDAVILKMCAALLSGFRITSWLSAIAGAFVLALVGLFLHWAIV